MTESKPFLSQYEEKAAAVIRAMRAGVDIRLIHKQIEIRSATPGCRSWRCEDCGIMLKVKEIDGALGRQLMNDARGCHG